MADVVARLERRFPRTKCNTYVDHPWPGWDGQSVDVWNWRGRGWAITHWTGLQVFRWLFDDPDPPFIRHIIYEHRLWTSFGGWSRWEPADHDDELRHVHVTFW